MKISLHYNKTFITYRDCRRNTERNFQDLISFEQNHPSKFSTVNIHRDKHKDLLITLFEIKL